jgi:branched-chain amino acid transport system permease protein
MGERMIKINWSLVGLVVLVLIAVFIPRVAPEYITILLTRALILSIVAMSLDIVLGYTNLGHIGLPAFFAIGAYTTAIMIVKLNSSFSVTVFSAIGISAAVSAIIALLLLRATGRYFLIISLSIAMCTWGLIYRWVSLTGGDNGITGIPRPHLDIPLDLKDTINFYHFILFFFVICVILMSLIVKSPYGKTLMGIRDSENRMKTMGYNVWLHKYLALIITGAFAGLSGNLYVYYNTIIGPNIADLASCFDYTLMVVIGGPGTLAGACLGSLIIVFLKELVSIYTTRWLLFLGAAYVITALYAPGGIIGLWLRYFKKEVTIIRW